MSNNHTFPGGGKSLPMTVDNVGFLLDRLGQDCAPLQFLRELTKNGEEAIGRTNVPGRIYWDVDWNWYDLADVMKLCVIDTGDGMTGEEMLKFINQLSSSGSVQSINANYGIGAKIAAATKNPQGIIYQSWKNGVGAMIQLEKDPATGEYGLKQWELNDGTFSYYVEIEDAIKPEEIDEHGTKVILLGSSDKENTMEPPEGTAAPSRWISKYLNTRYYVFPDDVTVSAREGWDSPRSDKDRNVQRTITGQKYYLDKHKTHSGVHKLETANVHWWILKDEPAITNNSGYIESAGHAAALYQDELYDRQTARAGTARLQNFGILFGTKFVVLYIEPISNDGSILTTNTARTTLLLNGEALPWADWAHEFRESMPTELVEFVNSKAAGISEKDHVKSIKERLKGIMDLYKVSRYKPTPQGVYLSDESSALSAGPSTGSGASSKGGGGGKGSSVGSTASGTRDGEIGNIYHLFEKKGGVSSDKVQTDPFPIVKWVSLLDKTREEGDMEDRAAKYLADQNTLLVNADFRVFRDMISRLCKAKETKQGANIESVVEDVVHAWFEQALVEAVIGIQQLKGSKEWGPDSIEDALSQESLTTTVMQRYHVHIACRRDLGAKLGKATETVPE
jgi:hypothetical protein